MARTTQAQTRISLDERGCEPSFHGLLSAFRRLDSRLKLLMESARANDIADASPYPGLAISESELNGLLELEPGESKFRIDEARSFEPLFERSDNGNPHLAWLAREYGLSDFEIDLLLIALAAELDTRYERIFAYLQDDVTRKRPSADLALNLLCSSKSARQESLARFMDSELIRCELLKLVPDSERARSWLVSQLKLEDGVVNLLLGRKILNERLAAFSELIDPEISLADVPISSELKRALQFVIARRQVQPLTMHFRGARGTGKRATAEALAAEMSALLIIVDVEHLLESAREIHETLKLVSREARLQQALLYLDDFDALICTEHAAHYQQALKALCNSSGITVLAGEKPVKSSAGILELPFPVQKFSERRACWEDNLRQRSLNTNAEMLDALAGGFRLPCGEIVAAIAASFDSASVRGAQPSDDDLFASARSRLSHNLAQFARKIEARYDWADLVLRLDQLSQLREICSRYKYQHVVYGEWGFDRKLSLGKGINALFSGHPGTGKTMAAEVIAGELHLDLYKIDLSQVVSKYIGETEKSLNQIFREAQDSSSILFFDEADALFGKRTEVKDSHDRYANIEVSYLLQKMEEYDGIAILATNFRQNMDEAFLRRMQFIVEFPFPDEEHRKSIWQLVFPKDSPLANDLDFGWLAREIRLAGGNIKSIGLAAAFYAASERSVISHEHLIRAARREFQKLGRTWHVSQDD